MSDWADKKHDVCVQFKNGERTFHVIEHTPEALDIWLKALHKLAALGDNRNRFNSAEEIQNYAGIAPVTERSGQKSWVHWRWQCAKFVRQTFVEWAAKTVNSSYWAKLYYQGQRVKGKSHQSAIRALAFKWIRIIYRCWKTRTCYDEAKYLLSLKERNSPLLKL